MTGGTVDVRYNVADGLDVGRVMALDKPSHLANSK